MATPPQMVALYPSAGKMEQFPVGHQARPSCDATETRFLCAFVIGGGHQQRPESMLVGTAPFIYLARILPGKTKTYMALN